MIAEKKNGTEQLSAGKANVLPGLFPRAFADILNVQKEQGNFAAEIFGKINEHLFSLYRTNLYTALNISEKSIETLRRNSAALFNAYRAAFKKIAIPASTGITGGFPNGQALQKMAEAFEGQLALAEELNDRYLESLQRQLDFSRSWLIPLAEKSQRELTRMPLAPAGMFFFGNNPYGEMFRNYFETGSAMLNGFNKQFGSLVQDNIRLWSGIMMPGIITGNGNYNGLPKKNTGEEAKIKEETFK